HDFLSRRYDRTGATLVEEPEFEINPGGDALDQRERPNYRQRHRFRADAEIPSRALGLCPPVTIRRDLDRAKRISFDPRVRHDGSRRSLLASLSRLCRA